MANFKPLQEVQVLSERKTAWLKEPCKKGVLKHTAIVNTMSSIPNPSRPEETLFDEAIRAEKLHDGHPELIVTEIEKRFGLIFDDIATTMLAKKAFISEFITCILRLGERRYGKPNLRKKEEVEEVLGVTTLSI